MTKTQPPIDANYPDEATVGNQSLRAPTRPRKRLAAIGWGTQQGFWKPIKQKAYAGAAGLRQWMRKKFSQS
ncbi:MAG: hypothetical protein U1E51_16580 [Candidatus Binatia bacterium]|nr:hypothetical protein [Candidatus Binatia bacterium]